MVPLQLKHCWLHEDLKKMILHWRRRVSQLAEAFGASFWRSRRCIVGCLYVWIFHRRFYNGIPLSVESFWCHRRSAKLMQLQKSIHGLDDARLQ